MILPRTHHSSPSPSTHLQQLTIHLVSAAMFLSRSILALIIYNLHQLNSSNTTIHFDSA
jgi:hypothetical protein